MNNKTETQIKILLPEQVAFVMNRLESAGFHAYVVGGCVRDALMGRIPGDYDVTTAAKPEEMQKIFEDCRVVETGLKHGTLTVVRDGMNIEVTTYRIDGTYRDGRHPDSVTFTDRLADDLGRRDFTVNAMAYSPAGGLVDLYDGQNDIANKIIRCVGQAEERFSEDGLRILRALRFASTLGFSCDAECSAAIFALTSLLDRISRERIHTELTKLLRGQRAAEILAEYASVIAHVLPPLAEEGVECAAKVFRAMNSSMNKETPDSVRFAVLLDSLDGETAGKVLDSLKPSRDEKRAVMNLLNHRDARDFDNYSVRLLMRDTTDDFPETLGLFLRLTGRISKEKEDALDRTAAEIIEKDECRRVSDLAVDGKDLLSLGLRGAEIGSTLDRLLECVMRGECENTADALVGEIKAGGRNHAG